MTLSRLWKLMTQSSSLSFATIDVEDSVHRSTAGARPFSTSAHMEQGASFRTILLAKSGDDPANLLLGEITNSVNALLEVKCLTGLVGEIRLVPEPMRQRLDFGNGFK